VEAILPLWKHKPKFSLTMYLGKFVYLLYVSCTNVFHFSCIGMGWTCLICMEDLAIALPTNAIYCIVAGGVAYIDT
jgi:predicted membrane channel-forming protein YqfA (hemolysin III family)